MAGDQLRLPDEYLTGWTPKSSRSKPIEARAEIARLRAAGYGATPIARSLNARGIPTPSGRGQWWPATVLRHADPGPWTAYIRRYRAQRR
jgi:hypothetical protein